MRPTPATRCAATARRLRRASDSPCRCGRPGATREERTVRGQQRPCRVVDVAGLMRLRPSSILEVDWGGVKVNGIPPLHHPRHIPAREATYQRDNHLVFGVVVNGAGPRVLRLRRGDLAARHVPVRWACRSHQLQARTRAPESGFHGVLGLGLLVQPQSGRWIPSSRSTTPARSRRFWIDRLRSGGCRRRSSPASPGSRSCSRASGCTASSATWWGSGCGSSASALALGASRHEIIAVVMRKGTTLLAAGAAIGIVAALASGRVLATLLYNVPAFDLASFSAADNLGIIHNYTRTVTARGSSARRASTRLRR